MSQSKIQFTQEGLDNLIAELDELKNSKRATAVDRLQKARAMGDLRENSEYSAAKEDLVFIEGRIQELEAIIANAEIVGDNSKSDIIDIGSIVKVEVNDTHHEYAIVGEYEANPIEKKLSHTSPIGKALLGKRKGEVIEIKIPAGITIYRIIEVKK